MEDANAVRDGHFARPTGFQAERVDQSAERLRTSGLSWTTERTNVADPKKGEPRTMPRPIVLKVVAVFTQWPR